MTHPDSLPILRPWPLVVSMLVFAGCAGNGPHDPHQQGVEMLEQGNMEEALAQLEKASQEAPGNREFRIHYLNARAQVIGRWLVEAQYERQRGQFDEAAALYRRILKIERDNAQAMAGLVAVVQERYLAKEVAEANGLMASGDLESAEQKIAQVLKENPRHAEALALRRQIEDRTGRNTVVNPALHKSFQKLVSLEFRDTALKQVLEALSRYAGLNFVVDKDVPPTVMVTVFLRQVSVEEALDVILTTNQLRRRVLNDTTLLIYPDTAAKLEDHQYLEVKNFFLANAEAKQVMNMLKTVLKARNVFADDKLNLLIMRDTPEMIRLAERMVSVQDVGEPEVMLELEVLEIQRSRLLNLGIKFPEQLTLSPLPLIGSVLTLKDLLDLGPGNTGAAISDTVLNLQRVVSNTNLLANPRIRTHNREKALIRIGDRVPVITTTATATGFLSENVQYIDVGLKLEVEPTIFPNDEISLKLALEVSSVTKEIVSKAGTTSYQIGGRNASTVLRLKDGETQILGGLINDQDITTANRFPGLGDLPMLGRLFSSQRDSKDKTELLLSITPRLVRGLAPPAQVPGEFWSGTEKEPRLKMVALSKKVPEATAAPADSAAAATSVVPPVLNWDGPASVKAGDSFKLVLKVSSPQAVASIPLQVTYDPAVFELINAAPGKFMAQGNTLVETSKRIEAGSGSVFMTQTRSGKTGASGAGDLLELEFRALKAASDSPINALPASPDQPVPAPFTPAAVTVTVVP